jgi:acetylornithine/succinyldiaminopimelate/putrescine aminotransferase
VSRKGERLAGGLHGLGLEPRGDGLMLAFACEEGPQLVRRLLLEQRLVANATGPDTVRLLPPLTVSEDEIDEAVRRIASVVRP